MKYYNDIENKPIFKRRKIKRFKALKISRQQNIRKTNLNATQRKGMGKFRVYLVGE
jgi:hypothetical protein